QPIPMRFWSTACWAALKGGSRICGHEPDNTHLAASGVGLVVAILIKGAAGVNSDRHALAAAVAERAFAGLFLVLLGWFVYDRIVAWTPL
ncbi:MAG: hypothetical protein ACRDSJ_00540, partial [Rubrobacteraceae bacterium]